jgi:hypothetical protein
MAQDARTVRHRREQVRSAPAGVNALLEALEEVFPSKYDDRVDALKERRERLSRAPVSFVLEPGDVGEVVVKPTEAGQTGESFRDVEAGVTKDPRTSDDGDP